MAFSEKTLEWLQKRVPDLPSPIREHVADLLEETILLQAQNTKLKERILEVVMDLGNRLDEDYNDEGTTKTAQRVIEMFARRGL